MKFVGASHFTDRDTAARRLVAIANAYEAGAGRAIYIELFNGHFLCASGHLDWLWLHQSGTYVKFTPVAFRLMAAKALDDLVALPRDRQFVTLWDTRRRHSLISTFRGSRIPSGNSCLTSRDFAANIAEPRCRRPTASGKIAVRLAGTPVALAVCPYGPEPMTMKHRQITR